MTLTLTDHFAIMFYLLKWVVGIASLVIVPCLLLLLITG
jgi:hypothetical protein